jgi:hypothetical protein
MSAVTRCLEDGWASSAPAPILVYELLEDSTGAENAGKIDARTKIAAKQSSNE